MDTPPSSQRLIAFDWMRGLVMVLMAVDHASSVFSHEKFQADAYVFGAAGAELPSTLIFLTRWITHLCAPTFVFLAGAALALSVEKRLARGESSASIDRHLLVRGVLLIALEVWVSLVATFPLLQVLYAIGGSILCMIVLRRFPTILLVAIALAWMAVGEWLTQAFGWKTEPSQLPMTGAIPGLLGWIGFYDLPVQTPAADAFAVGKVLFLYPLLPWLAIMMLGWSCGRWILPQLRDPEMPRRVSRVFVITGLLALGVFVAQRCIDGYGNFWLPRGDDASALRWLQVSKYPPSLAFCALELGLMALLLAMFFRLQSRRVSSYGPLLVLGQTALFFYLVHAHIMWAARLVMFGWSDYSVLAPKPWGLASAWLGAAATIAVLYPMCLLYRRVKQARPNGILRYF